MNSWTLWMVGGLMICAAEMLHPGVYLLWIGLAACAAGLFTVTFDVGYEAQMIAFVAFVPALLAIPILRGRRYRRESDVVNAPDAGLIGATCRSLGFVGNEGRVQLRDGAWQARSADGDTPIEGTILQIVGLDGTVLLVSNAKRPKA